MLDSAAIGQGALVLAALQALFFWIRRLRLGPGFQILYQLWAFAVAWTVTAAGAEGLAEGGLWRFALGAAAILGTLIALTLFDRAVLRRPWDPSAGGFFPKLGVDIFRFGALLAVSLLIASRVYAVELSTLVISSTVLTAVVGFSLQDVLQNIFSGLAMQLEKPFEIGDWVDLDGRPAEVVEMTWRSTRLRDCEGLMIVEPNTVLGKSRVVGYGTGQPPVALRVMISLPLDVPPARAKAVLSSAAEKAPDVLRVEVFVDQIEDWSVAYLMRIWTNRVEAIAAVRDEVQSRIWYATQRAQIPFPLPTQSLLFHDMARESEERKTSSRQRIRERIRSLELFAELDDEAVERLVDQTRRRFYANGELLCQEGGTDAALFVVEDGVVGIDMQTTTGEHVHLANLGPGEVFGEVSLLTGEQRSATASAHGPVDVLVIDSDAMRPILAQDPEVARILSRALALHLSRTAEAIARTQANQAGARTESAASLLNRIRGFFKLHD